MGRGEWIPAPSGPPLRVSGVPRLPSHDTGPGPWQADSSPSLARSVLRACPASNECAPIRGSVPCVLVPERGEFRRLGASPGPQRRNERATESHSASQSHRTRPIARCRSERHPPSNQGVSGPHASMSHASKRVSLCPFAWEPPVAQEASRTLLFGYSEHIKSLLSTRKIILHSYSIAAISLDVLPEDDENRKRGLRSDASGGEEALRTHEMSADWDGEGLQGTFMAL